MTFRYRRALAVLGFWAAWLAFTVAALGRAVTEPLWSVLAVLAASCGLLAASAVHLVRPKRALTVSPGGVRGMLSLQPWGDIEKVELRGTERWPSVRLRSKRRLRSIGLAQWLVTGAAVDGVAQAATAAGVVVEDRRRPTSAGARVLHVGGLAVSAVGLVALTLLMVVPGLWVEGAGTVIEAHGRLRTAGQRERGQSGGEVLILTVHEGPASVEDVLGRRGSDRFAWRSPWWSGGDNRRTPQDDTAEESAVAAGLRCAGRPVAVEPGGVRVGRVAARLAGRVRTGDRTVAVAGALVAYPEDVFAAVAGMEPGREVTFSLTGADGETRSAQVVLARSPDGPVVPAGVELLRGPVRVTTPESAPAFDLDDTTGDSAGLAMAITVVDSSRTGGLVPKGAKVAVTGSVSPDGLVGPVGGVRFKAAAARDAGATVLLVPATQVAVAVAVAGDGLRVVGVRTVSDALQALGGTPC